MPSLIDKIVTAIIDPLILLLIAGALVLFLWGGFEFIINAGGSEGRDKGKRHLLWGIIGLFVMMGVLGIIRILAITIGFCNTVPDKIC